MKPRILIVDDEERMRRVLTMLLSDMGVEIEDAADGQVAYEMIMRADYDLVITDLRMPRLDGVGLLRKIKAEGRNIPVILITAYGDVESAVESMREGAFDYIQKPFEEEKIKISVERTLNVSRLINENRLLRREIESKYDFGSIIGNSPAMLKALDLAGEVSKTDTTVLITGESGTGKELIARAVHYNSARSRMPFVALNCAAIPETLLESELFGHEKGAFTGAHERRKGRFEQADGGSLFLDEIGELSPAVQVKLLRVIESKQFERVGGTKTLTSDVRIITATNRDLSEMVAGGGFREDLYYRINIFPINLPSLSQRRDDILLLAENFLERFSREMGKPVGGFSPEAEKLLINHKWAGNVRELQNAIERALILCNSDMIQPGNLPAMIAGGNAGIAAVPESRKSMEQINIPDEGIDLEETEINLIRQALKKAGGNKSKAARLLGLTRATLKYRLEKYKLS